MEFLKKLFSENSEVSSTRVMCFIAICAATGIAISCVYQKSDLEKAAFLVGAFLVPAFGGKVIQKKYENQEPTNGN